MVLQKHFYILTGTPKTPILCSLDTQRNHNLIMCYVVFTSIVHHEKQFNIFLPLWFTIPLNLYLIYLHHTIDHLINSSTVRMTAKVITGQTPVSPGVDANLLNSNTTPLQLITGLNPS
jgi:hypothetical protein